LGSLKFSEILNIETKNNFSDPVIPTCQYVVSTLYWRVVAKSKRKKKKVIVVLKTNGLWMALSIF